MNYSNHTINNNSQDRILSYSKMCNLAYGKTFNHKLLGFSSQKMIRGTFNRAFCRILKSDSECVVLFRGTRELYMDWPTNLLCWPARVDLNDFQCKVHAGFLNGVTGRRVCHKFRRAIDVLKELLQPVLCGDPPTRLVFIGHSLGGAYAVLAAAMIEAEHSGTVSEVVTFGQPAVGGRSFKEWYKSVGLHDRTTRFMHEADIVTFLPGPRFEHVGTGWWSSGGKWLSQLGWHERIARAWNTRRVLQFIGDHSVKNYVEICRNLPPSFP